MLFVALNRTELRSRNKPIFRSPSVNTHGLLVVAVHRCVRVRGSTPAYSYTSVNLSDVHTDSRNLTSGALRVVACLEGIVDERNTYVKLSGTFTHIRIRMRKNHH